MHWILSWLVMSVAVWLTAYLVPGVHVKGFMGAVVVAAVFGILNVLLGWLLFGAIGIGTLGIGFLLGFITRLVVNAILLKLTEAFTDSLSISGFGNALLAALVISVIGSVGQAIIR